MYSSVYRQRITSQLSLPSQASCCQIRSRCKKSSKTTSGDASIVFPMETHALCGFCLSGINSTRLSRCMSILRPAATPSAPRPTFGITRIANHVADSIYRISHARRKHANMLVRTHARSRTCAHMAAPWRYLGFGSFAPPRTQCTQQIPGTAMPFIFTTQLWAY